MINLKQKFKKIYHDMDLSDYDINAEIDFVIEMLTGLSSTDIFLGKEITKVQEEKIEEIINIRVKTHKPLQQIIGKSYFAGDIYSVNKYTLIPRPETEFLVEKCKQVRQKDDEIKILDIGTGSGCIAIELAKFYVNSKITAIDVCQETLDTALLNAGNKGVIDRIDFIKSDLFENVEGFFDIIVSNPPYIPVSTKIQEDVYCFEPHRALFAPENGLFFYKKIIKEGKKLLNKNAFMAFEVGYNQADSVFEIFQQNGFVNISFTQDCDSINRVVSAYLF